MWLAIVSAVGAVFGFFGKLVDLLKKSPEEKVDEAQKKYLEEIERAYEEAKHRGEPKQ